MHVCVEENRWQEFCMNFPDLPSENIDMASPLAADPLDKRRRQSHTEVMQNLRRRPYFAKAARRALSRDL